MKKGTKAITMLLAIVFIFGLIANCGSPIMAEEAVSEQKDFLKILNFDPEEMPKSSKSVVFLQGSWYEMGYQYGTQVPDVVKRAIETYRKDNDWLGHFIEECCELDDTFQEKSGELYQEYRAYCSRTGEYVRSTTDFYNGLDSIGVERKRTAKGVIARGIRLTLENSEESPL